MPLPCKSSVRALIFIGDAGLDLCWKYHLYHERFQTSTSTNNSSTHSKTSLSVKGAVFLNIFPVIQAATADQEMLRLKKCILFRSMLLVHKQKLLTKLVILFCASNFANITQCSHTVDVNYASVRVTNEYQASVHAIILQKHIWEQLLASCCARCRTDATVKTWHTGSAGVPSAQKGWAQKMITVANKQCHFSLGHNLQNGENLNPKCLCSQVITWWIAGRPFLRVVLKQASGKRPQNKHYSPNETQCSTDTDIPPKMHSLHDPGQGHSHSWSD